MLHPMPTKTRVSFDVPALLDKIKAHGEYPVAAKFEDVLLVRNYIQRHKLPISLSQCKVDGGFILSLKEKA